MANPPYKTPPRGIPHMSSPLSPPEMKRSGSFGALNAATASHNSSASFNSNTSSKTVMSKHKPVYLTPVSPPNHAFPSPQKGHLDNETGVRDPQLFPQSDGVNAIAPNEPLFPQEQVSSAVQNVVNDTDRVNLNNYMNSPEYKALPIKPPREDYETVLKFQSTVFDEYKKDPKAWARTCERHDELLGPHASRIKKNAGLNKPTPKKLAPAPSHRSKTPSKSILRVTHSPRVEKTPRKRTPPARNFDDLMSRQGTPIVSPTNAKSGKPNKTDENYMAIPDYTPPAHLLPKHGFPKPLTSGKPKDLSHDPNRNLLNDHEIYLASQFRFTCAAYICVKRKIFRGKVEALEKGKGFLRTDAQKVCNVDVNKGSQLWASFDKVGWFEPHHFTEILKERARKSLTCKG